MGCLRIWFCQLYRAIYNVTPINIFFIVFGKAHIVDAVAI